MFLKNIIVLIGFVVLAQLVGVFGNIFTNTAIQTWYVQINKPDFTPPNWVFGPVWITLYFLMGVAMFLIWRRRDASGSATTFALWFFVVHLAVNALWSLVFFGMQSPVLGLIAIGVLWVMIVMSIILFWRVRPWAGYLLVPYLLWVSYASVLNYAIWTLNS